MKMVNLRLRMCLLAHIRSRLGRRSSGKKTSDVTVKSKEEVVVDFVLTKK